jgi:hypothetical protein
MATAEIRQKTMVKITQPLMVIFTWIAEGLKSIGHRKKNVD